MSKDGVINRKAPHQQAFADTVLGRSVAMVAKLYGTIFVLAVFMKWNEDEATEHSPPLTWVAAMYFATTTATSVG